MRRGVVPVIDRDEFAEALTHILDGHNILYACRQAFLEHLVDGHPGTAARVELVRRVVAAFPAPGPEVRVYFDGSEAGTESPSPNVQVIYPGGDGEQRADRAILKYVAELAGQGGTTPVLVVTRDLDLARRARKRGASIVAPGDFLREWQLDVP